MHMAVPVIVSDQVNSWPHVETAGAGMVLKVASIPSLLPQAITEMLRDREGLGLAGRRGQNYARKHLTWAAASAMLMECYEEVIWKFAVPRPGNG
jgi:glycosyltransferase involved in cell wall biosynthesis